MPEDMDIYMKKIKQRADETDNVMGKIKADKMAELDKLRIDNEMEEVRARLEKNKAEIRESQKTGQTLAPKQAYNFAELLFAGRPPEEIKQIMDSLDEAALDKLAYLGGAMNSQQLGVFTQTLRRPETNVKDTIELINTVVKMNQRPTEQSGITLQGVAALMKEAREAHTSQAPQQSHTDKYLDLLLEELKLARQDQAKDREARLEKEIAEIRTRPSAMDEIARDAEKFNTYRKMFGSGDSATANEYTLKKLEMEQTERLEDRKIGFEEKKWQYEKENEGKTIEQVKDLVKTVTEGPVGKVLESLGEAGADKIRGSGKKNSPNIVQITCPNCQEKFRANDQLAKIDCPLCGAELQKATASAPQPPPAPQTSQPEPEQEQPPQPEQKSKIRKSAKV